MKIENEFSDVTADVNEDNGWITLNRGDDTITLGVPPNARTEIIDKAIRHSLKFKRLKRYKDKKELLK